MNKRILNKKNNIDIPAKKILSICIPTYNMSGLGKKYLKHSLDILTRQTFTDFDIVITDNSENDSIEDLCKKYKNTLDIKYSRNERNIGMTANVNRAIKKANGKIIKILFQDDFLFSEKSLENIINGFDLKNDKWLVTACEHSKDGVNFYRPFYPRYNKKIHLGKNTISSPSVLTIKNENPLLFDEKLIWFMDCDYYKRCYDKFGEPKILNIINVVNRIGPHQTSNISINSKEREKEYIYSLKKNNEKYFIYLVINRKIKRYLLNLKKTIKKI